ncbi:DUF4142 domain-containing protein [Aeromicrobium sp. Leaf350]|uniref:DUF4142 domain-containing protein n=1 Tax=Aeromicrobium sp. Leaf350 TaxID=2876565 RepID=UPI001E3FF9C1|nr:DUF4142 domain-containing protein [Aeromicrobium sp. Leaf350]
MRALRLLVGLALSLTLVACGAEDGDPDGPPHAGADRIKADEIYVGITSGTLGTLRQIAELADDSAGSVELQRLASEIVEELGDVRDELAAYAEEWELRPTMSSTVLTSSSQDRSDDWQRLEELEGAEFDVLWIDVVAGSLEAIASSAETVIDVGENVGLRELATGLLDTCEAWIDDLAELAI